MRIVEKLRDFEYRLRQVNAAAGFTEVSVPQTGLSAIYERGIKDSNMIRFTEGPDVYALRSDFTTAIVHSLVKGRRIYDSLAVSYFGKVFRKEFRNNESYQAGVELLFEGGVSGDLRILRHAGEFIKSLGARQYVICVGLAPFIESLRLKLSLSDSRFAELVTAMQEHNHVDLHEILAESLSPAEYRDIRELFTSRDNQRILKLLQQHFPLVFRESRIEEIIAGLDDHFVLDLSLVKSLDYYTGIIFDAYISDYPYSLLYGGRYDRLAGQFGGSFPAVGFAMNLDYVLENNDGEFNK